MRPDFYAVPARDLYDTLLYRLCAASDNGPLWCALRLCSTLARASYVAAWHGIAIDEAMHEAYIEGGEPSETLLAYHEAVCRIASSDVDRWHDTYTAPSILPIDGHNPLLVRRAICIALALVDGYLLHHACPHSGTDDAPPCYEAWATSRAYEALHDESNEALRMLVRAPHTQALADTWQVWGPLP